MAMDKVHWLPVHSLMLMSDQLHCMHIFCLPTVDHTIGVKNILSQLMSENDLPFVGNYLLFFIAFANTFQIQTKYQTQIHVLL